MNRWVAQIWAEDRVATRLLAPIAAIWGAVAGGRMRRAPAGEVAIPVIAVGNFTVGGAGKTPTVDALVARLAARGRRPVVVTRGYGGREAGPLIVDPARHDARAVGDEALLHARVTTTIVARDRLAGAREAERIGGDVVLLDDGFQNPRLAKDLALVVVDRAAGLGNGRVMPAGPLRAPLATQLTRTSAILLIDSGEGTHPSTERLIERAQGLRLPILGARIAPRSTLRLQGRRVIGFAGIGRPGKFAATLSATGATIVDFVPFPDHHPFTAQEAGDLLERAVAADAELVTTAKDAVRLLGQEGILGRLGAAARVLDIGLVFDDEARITALLDTVAPRGGAQPRP
jgi:tetraacyldisaccharide 4'-kinase